MISIEDNSILERFVQDEMEDPTPRKHIDGYTIYASRIFRQPKTFGDAVISDLGEAEDGKLQRHHNAQPNWYRSPEVMLKADWSYPADIWNVGAMIWDLFEGKGMFFGDDPEFKVYSTRAHLAEIIGMLGPPPLDLLKRGRRVDEFFDEKGISTPSTVLKVAYPKFDVGNFIAEVAVPDNSLEGSEERLEGDNKKAFLEFMRSMLQWRPEDRKTAKDLLQDPWLNS
ncbi:hypothetical protein PMZ80_010085 [Knufia obscura]|uniref:Protein kinase domain-containing protein n=2 Tax=Knufia TaxID=430999 RepID=A0AAN8F7G6_9EURO|nr:hypothetical protein PMZ80_010085 [Knufia obscura]KAK5952826.1 hypothetical protein OHC33_005945 [Knufia fluminis]